MKSYLSKNQSIFLLVFMLVLGSFILANPVHASWFGDAVAQLIGWIVYAFVYVIGLLIMLVMWVLIKIAQYNDFINASPVQYGWTIVRDVCNMFFILILLIIAFATILRVEKYSFKTLLPKLILMAVLINFSKLICGVFIDFTQVIMLTFVNGFKDIGTGNLTNMLGIDKIMSMDSTNSNVEGSEVSAWSIVGAYMLALMYSVIALITLVTMLAVLAMRMIMIWVYVVLSPMAYLLSAFPAGEKYASQWWEEFSKNLIVGPILAFFIWLSFVSLGGVENPPDIDKISQLGKTMAEADTTNITGALTASTTGPSAGITEAGSPDHMIKFIISIAMLVGGLQISQQLGGQAGGMAGKGMAKMQKMGAATAGSIGTQIKRRTGIERVQMAYKSYQDTKSSERTAKVAGRAKDDAAMVNNVIGRTKQTVGKFSGKVMGSATSGITRGLTLKSERELAKAQTAKETIQTDRTSKEKELKEVQAKLDKSGSSADRITGRKAIQLDERITDDKERNEQLAKYDAETNDIKKNEDIKASLTVEIKESEVKEAVEDATIAKAKGRQETASKWVNRGVGAVVGAGVGALTGNALLAMGGAWHGGKAKENLDTAGEANLKRVANYNNEKIATSKESLKNSGEAKIMEVISKTKNKHEHAAATAIALEKGYFKNSNAAAEQKNKVHDRFKSDEKITQAMNTSAEKNYIELSPPYADLGNAKKVLEDNNSTAEQKASAVKSRDAANAKISAGLDSGSVKLSDMSNTAITLAIDAIATSMKDKTFQKQYDGASDAQKSTLKIALDQKIKSAETAGSSETDPTKKKEHYEEAYSAKKKLAYTEGLNLNRFGDSDPSGNEVQKESHEHKKRFLASMTDSDAAKAAKNKGSKEQFLQEIQIHLKANGAKIDSNSTNEEIAEHLKDILPNAGLETLDSVSKTVLTAVKGHITKSQPKPQAQQTPPPPPPSGGPTVTNPFGASNST
ncbi:MAG: hypothetical protein WCJ57_01600, partial [Candidatus Falkowbacteria bacterium]